jgi:hypothetical protein
MLRAKPLNGLQFRRAVGYSDNAGKHYLRRLACGCPYKEEITVAEREELGSIQL